MHLSGSSPSERRVLVLPSCHLKRRLASDTRTPEIASLYCQIGILCEKNAARYGSRYTSCSTPFEMIKADIRHLNMELQNMGLPEIQGRDITITETEFTTEFKEIMENKRILKENSLPIDDRISLNEQVKKQLDKISKQLTNSTNEIIIKTITENLNNIANIGSYTPFSLFFAHDASVKVLELQTQRMQPKESGRPIEVDAYEIVLKDIKATLNKNQFVLTQELSQRIRPIDEEPRLIFQSEQDLRENLQIGALIDSHPNTSLDVRLSIPGILASYFGIEQYVPSYPSVKVLKIIAKKQFSHKKYPCLTRELPHIQKFQEPILFGICAKQALQPYRNLYKLLTGEKGLTECLPEKHAATMATFMVVATILAYLMYSTQPIETTAIAILVLIATPVLFSKYKLPADHKLFFNDKSVNRHLNRATERNAAKLISTRLSQLSQGFKQYDTYRDFAETMTHLNIGNFPKIKDETKTTKDPSSILFEASSWFLIANVLTKNQENEHKSISDLLTIMHQIQSIKLVHLAAISGQDNIVDKKKFRQILQSNTWLKKAIEEKYDEKREEIQELTNQPQQYTRVIVAQLVDLMVPKEDKAYFTTSRSVENSTYDYFNFSEFNEKQVKHFFSNITELDGISDTTDFVSYCDFINLFLDSISDETSRPNAFELFIFDTKKLDTAEINHEKEFIKQAKKQDFSPKDVKIMKLLIKLYFSPENNDEKFILSQKQPKNYIEERLHHCLKSMLIHQRDLLTELSDPEIKPYYIETIVADVLQLSEGLFFIQKVALLLLKPAEDITNDLGLQPEDEHAKMFKNYRDNLLVAFKRTKHFNDFNSIERKELDKKLAFIIDVTKLSRGVFRKTPWMSNLFISAHSFGVNSARCIGMMQNEENQSTFGLPYLHQLIWILTSDPDQNPELQDIKHLCEEIKIGLENKNYRYNTNGPVGTFYLAQPPTHDSSLKIPELC